MCEDRSTNADTVRDDCADRSNMGCTTAVPTGPNRGAYGWILQVERQWLRHRPARTSYRNATSNLAVTTTYTARGRKRISHVWPRGYAVIRCYTPEGVPSFITGQQLNIPATEGSDA